MEHEFWHQKWNEGSIGFHQSEINTQLKEHFPKLAAGSRVLVPLCGKSKDMLWLREQGYQVTGVELNQKAVKEFFSDNQLAINNNDENRYSTDSIELYCQDIFTFQAPPFAAIYDRAALVALPAPMRRDYAAHLKKLLDKRGQLLLITFEYEQSQVQGPPFSVSQEEVEELFSPQLSVKLVSQESETPKSPKFAQANIRTLLKKSYLIAQKD